MNHTATSDPPDTSSRVGVVILAAGQGTRMRSRLPKVLHPVAGRPMVREVVEIGRALQPVATALVVGHAAEAVSAVAGPSVSIVYQTEQLGTGHAVLQARELLRGRSDVVVVLYGDTVLLRPATLRQMIDAARRAPVVILTGVVEDPSGYARIERDPAGQISRLIELPGGAPEYEALREINSGVMVFAADWLWAEVGRLARQPSGEFFLTDLVNVALAQGHSVESVRPAETVEILGINTQAQLAEANRIVLDRIRRDWLDAGVRMTDPSSVFVDTDVVLEADVVVHPNTHLQGTTRVLSATEIGPNSIVRDSQIGKDCRVLASVVEEASVGDRVHIGPFTHLRPGARIEDGVELGNYAEVKESTIGAGARMHHFGYIGDATIGPDANIGAGTVTCNFDGAAKHRSIVGAGAFVGSDTMLVAPVEVGDGARTGAGAVVTRDVKPGELVVGAPARPVPGRAPGEAGRDKRTTLIEAKEPST